MKDIPSFPQWKFINNWPYTKIDDTIYTVTFQIHFQQAIYRVYRVEDEKNTIMLEQKFNIEDHNLVNINELWAMIKDLLPSLIMEAYL